ncbi:MAG: hypothetical protein R2764_23120 [Bacteroidales bacterium]
MKNKKVLYILLPAVFIVWGYIAFKIFGHLYRNDSVPFTQGEIKTVAKKNSIPDTFSLINNYPDPFLKRRIKKNNTVSKRVKKTIYDTKKIVWPVIKYTGRMENQHTKKSLVSITVNGKECIFKTGEQRKILLY